MTDPLARYKNALTAFAQPGCRWTNKGALTYWGKAAGLSADQIIADARAAGVRDRDADIRRGWKDAKTRDAANMANYTPRAAKPKPSPKYEAYVKYLIGDMGICDFDAVRETSPCLDWIGKSPNEQTAMFLRAAFRPNEVLFAFSKNAPRAGVLGVNLRTARDWMQTVERGGAISGDLIVPNPFSGEQRMNADQRPSLIVSECLASFPYIILEFDEMSLERQCAFWRAFVLKSDLAQALVALTFSGNRSIHGLINVGCDADDDFTERRKVLCGLFASDADETFRADIQAMLPRTGTRLPGVLRFDNRSCQELLYLNPNVREDNMWQT